MTSPWHQITSLCQSSYAQKWNDEYIIVCNFGGRRMSGFEVIGGGEGGGGEGGLQGARRSQKAKKSPVWLGLIQASVASAHAAYRQMYWLKIVESRWIAEKEWKHYFKYDAKTPYSLFLNYLLLLQFAPSMSGSLAGGKIESPRFTLKFWVSIGFNFLQWDNSNILTKKKRK